MGSRTKGLLSGMVTDCGLVELAETVQCLMLNVLALRDKEAGFDSETSLRGVTCPTSNTDTRRLKSSNIKPVGCVANSLPSCPSHFETDRNNWPCERARSRLEMTSSRRRGPRRKSITTWTKVLGNTSYSSACAGSIIFSAILIQLLHTKIFWTTAGFQLCGHSSVGNDSFLFQSDCPPRSIKTWLD